MEKRINNILFLNGKDGSRRTLHVLFTHHSDEFSKDYAVFVSEEDENHILLFSYDENKTLSMVNNEEEIALLETKLYEFDEQMGDIIFEDDEMMLSKLNKYMYEDIHLNSLDEDIRRFVPDEVFETLEIAKETVDFLSQAYDKDDGPYVYAIILKNNLKNIGYVQLVSIEEGYEIGYHIAKQYTNKGYATKAVKLFLRCLKEKAGAKELYGITMKENIASQKVLKKCGFKTIFEGIGTYHGEQREIVKTIINLNTNN